MICCQCSLGRFSRPEVVTSLVRHATVTQSDLNRPQLGMRGGVMSRWLGGVSRFALVASVATLIAPGLLLANPFTVTTGSTDTAAKTVTDAETGTVQSNATLSVTATAITWSGATQPSGVIINNSGTITSGNRGID